MDKGEIIIETAQLLEKDLALPVPKGNMDRDGLIKYLEPLIHQLLNRDFEKLLQVCYRIDLGEEKLKEILHESPPEQLSKDLSTAIVDRQILKIQIRRKYQ
ncbi:hypothetical protein QWY93_09710 [Echinicola jeungdonensis]|uniref:Uncharacterized protein n=1 Tax=Echinicola jeungdonensis TaxID=709343 RepID=A0ABV5J3R6_9BACT|nr:hypothetical protein [Echinicola jeungdonensis]MDN3669604.1 hypothetical protein [Echinicola jeungdonensis]